MEHPVTWPFEPTEEELEEMPVNEREAFEKGLAGPVWWLDEERILRRVDERRSARYIFI